MKNEQNSRVSLQEMVKAGVHIGHHASKWHPKMAQYIHGSKNKLHIINLEQTQIKLDEALDFIEKTVASGKDITFVATKKQVVPIVREAAEASEMPYAVKRWVGGTFTNFKIISKRMKQLVQLEEKLAAGQLQTHTKKERKVFQDKVDKGNKLFAGLKGMRGLPGAVLVEDVSRDTLAIKEAHDMGIPVIGLTDTNTNPELVDYPIPANDDAVSSVKLIYAAITATIVEAKAQRKQKLAESASAEKSAVKAEEPKTEKSTKPAAKKTSEAKEGAQKETTASTAKPAAKKAAPKADAENTEKKEAPKAKKVPAVKKEA